MCAYSFKAVRKVALPTLEVYNILKNALTRFSLDSKMLGTSNPRIVLLLVVFLCQLEPPLECEQL